MINKYILILHVDYVYIFIYLKRNYYIKIHRTAEIRKMNFWCMSLGLALVFYNALTEVCADLGSRNAVSLISSFLYENKISFAVIINCGTAGNCGSV